LWSPLLCASQAAFTARASSGGEGRLRPRHIEDTSSTSACALDINAALGVDFISADRLNNPQLARGEDWFFLNSGVAPRRNPQGWLCEVRILHMATSKSRFIVRFTATTLRVTSGRPKGAVKERITSLSRLRSVNVCCRDLAHRGHRGAQPCVSRLVAEILGLHRVGAVRSRTPKCELSIGCPSGRPRKLRLRWLPCPGRGPV